MSDVLNLLGSVQRVRIELSRGRRVRRDAQGRLVWISPLPCPFPYGYVPGVAGGDGAELDAIVLSYKPLTEHTELSVLVTGVVRFADAGAVDDKLICGEPTADWQRVVTQFFHRYTHAKRLWYRSRGVEGYTGVRAIFWR